MNEYLKQLADVASRQGCVVSQVCWIASDVALVLLVGPKGSAQPYRVTTHKAGFPEFGDGRYFAALAAAQADWTVQRHDRGVNPVPEPYDPAPDFDEKIVRGIVNECIDKVAELHSAIYNPDDKRPAEPMLASLERLLGSLR